ncbi:putative hemolysin [Loktanella ponticola]|uniref:L-ornithine N(alpha)-acyltransferase n=1 Tax=Yoonia ponticola TaxID=1524255 RepID=A0A7W9BNV9_9RHOB|nr:GNAT family N-acyltransferase [Yoonia ponticola]MBB5723840.1 putative hemolysin [Yoonia ponticola]
MNIASQQPRFSVSLAQSDEDIAAVQRLRYDVFAAELGASGAGIDHADGRESDVFDAFADHLILRDITLSYPNQIIGTYRLLSDDNARAAGGFYSASEYDLTTLTTSGFKLLELSRSCILPAYRGGTALLRLWQGLAAYVEDNKIDYLFGVASFSGTDITKHQQALTLLHDQHLAPKSVRTMAQGDGAVPLQQMPLTTIDRRSAMMAMPPLIKAYLRMGGVVGDGAFVDHDFQTIDVCMILETAQLSARHRAFLGSS